ncbi:MAG: hypothetical protein GY876_09240, partial [Planctomycetes bacterium]|nr:hypothetical protein [Planctomycetota bacterium]
GTANVTGASTFSGPVMIADNANIQQDLDVAGKINAERLYLNGPEGETRFDGVINRISGDITEIRSDLVVEREAFFERGIHLFGPEGETRLDGFHNRISGMVTEIRSDLLVERDAFFQGDARFDREVRLEGPITEPKHATTKEYVDALSARAAARVAALANVDLQNASPEIDGVTLAAGDRVLLAGQTSAAENGLYVADANGALTRAGDFDAANEIDGGAHLFIQEGSQAGQGYVLADLGENFELGTGDLAFSRFTVDPTQSLALGDDLDVAGQINAERIYLEGGPFGDIRFDGFHNRLFGEINEFRSIESLFRSDFSIFDGHRVDFRNDITLFRGDEVIFDNHRTIFDTEVLLEGPITDPKHATTKEYVDALSARSAARVAALANVDLQNASPEIDGVTLAAGDRVLLAGQANAAENGLYVADANGALTRAGDFDNANEIDGGAHLFIQEGSQAGQGYVLADLGENFELGTGELSFSRFTVDPTQSLELGNDLNVAGEAHLDGPRTRIGGDLLVERDAWFEREARFMGPVRLEGPTEIRSDLLVERDAWFEREARFMGPVRLDGPTEIRGDLFVERDAFFGGEVRLDGPMTRIRGDLLVEHNAFFDGEVRLVGPITEPKHATSKEYVDDRYIENRVRIDQARADSLDQYDDNRQRIDHARDESHALHHENRVRIDQARTDSLDQYDDNRQRIEAAQQSLQAKPAARVAALANVDLQNASPEIDGVILAAGDRVLLAAQTNAAENGLYVADANGALTRA